MTDAPPTTGLHHVTNICTDMAEHFAFGVEGEEDPGTEEIDPFEGR